MGVLPGEILTELNVGWDDLQGDISQGAASSTLTYQAYRDTSFLMYFMRHDQDDALNMRYQTTHGWDPTSDVRAHIHIVPMADPISAQVVYFTGEYSWAKHGAEVPASASWVQFTVSHTVSPGDAFKPAIVHLFQASPPAGALESDMLLIHLIRAGTDPSDTYTTSKSGGTAAANVGLLSADVHYNRNKVGTVAPVPS